MSSSSSSISESTSMISVSFAVSRRCSSTMDKSDAWRETVGASRWSFDDVVKLMELNDDDGSGVKLSNGRFWIGADSRRL